MDDDREPPINPYQSPRADLTAEEEAASPERVYGLREPIRIEGKLSVEDFREKHKLTRWEKVRSAFLILASMVAVVVILVGNWLLQPGFSGLAVLPVVGLVVVLLVLMGIWVFVVWGSKGYEEHIERTTVLTETTFDEEGLVAEAKEGREAIGWSAFTHAEVRQRIVVLYLQSGHCRIYPRRFLADDRAWETFVGLVRCKVPVQNKGAGKRRAMRPQRVEIDELAVAVGGRPEHDPLIRARGALSWEDWRHIQRTIGRSCGDRVVSIGCFVLFVAFVAVLAWWQRGELPAWMNQGLAWGMAVLVFSSMFVLPPLRLRRQWKRQEGPFAPYEVRFWDDGVEIIDPTSAAFIPWTGFEKSTRSDQVLLLHQGLPAMLIRCIPRSFLASEEEWQSLLDLVGEKLPEESSQTASSRSE